MAVLTTPRRTLLLSRDDELDSVLALRRIAAHLGGLDLVGDAPADAALVCDDADAARRLLAAGVPVVHLRSGHPAKDEPPPPEGVLSWAHRPGWLPGPTTGRPTGALAPARPAQRRSRSGTLLLLSLWGVPDGEAGAFVSGPLPGLVREAVRRTGSCTVVSDARLDGALHVTEADVDALHASCAVLLASPTLGALTLAHARRSPAALLPPLGDTQRDLAGRVLSAASLPWALDPGGAWGPPDDNPWAALDPSLDDLRGAQRVARSLRQLTLAPW
ncbi:CGA synthase-related protein [Streptomyces luteireticuli]|uniref:CGA synthase-related protein n=1 Tax=Streptomyces luteireticuli TaxID=173858 RepID=UPI0031D31802